MAFHCDVHTHILPEIDDGSPDVQISVMLLDVLQQQGVDHVALTPHFYSHKDKISRFISRRQASLEELRNEYTGNIVLHTGCEVYVTEGLFMQQGLKALCYGSSSYMLTEFNYNYSFSSDSKAVIYINKLLNEYGITPVIAHIERYHNIINNMDNARRLIDMGCKFQINLMSLSSFFESKKILKLMNNNMIFVLGTDTHSFDKGLQYDTGTAKIEKHCGSLYLEQLNKNAEKILEI